MRRWFSVLLSVLLLSTLCIVAFAAQLPTAVEREGNTYIETFHLKDAGAEANEFWKAWQQSERNVLLASAGGISFVFMIVPEDGVLTFQDVGGEFYSVRCSKAYQYARFATDPNDDTIITYQGLFTVASGTALPFSLRYVVTGTLFQNHTLPTLSYDYLVTTTGLLYLVDDLGGGGEEGGGFWEQIWGWLSSFWDKLKALIISLFVPEDGYFTNWLKEIKDAFEAKTGGLTEVFEQVGGIFEGLKNAAENKSSIKIEVPDNQFFPGYKGIKVDLLGSAGGLLSWLRGTFNGILVLMTLIICYHKLTDIIRQ